MAACTSFVIVAGRPYRCYDRGPYECALNLKETRWTSDNPELSLAARLCREMIIGCCIHSGGKRVAMSDTSLKAMP